MLVYIIYRLVSGICFQIANKMTCILAYLYTVDLDCHEIEARRQYGMVGVNVVPSAIEAR